MNLERAGGPAEWAIGRPVADRSPGLGRGMDDCGHDEQETQPCSTDASPHQLTNLLPAFSHRLQDRGQRAEVTGTASAPCEPVAPAWCQVGEWRANP